MAAVLGGSNLRRTDTTPRTPPPTPSAHNSSISSFGLLTPVTPVEVSDTTLGQRLGFGGPAQGLLTPPADDARERPRKRPRLSSSVDIFEDIEKEIDGAHGGEAFLLPTEKTEPPRFSDAVEYDLGTEDHRVGAHMGVAHLSVGSSNDWGPYLGILPDVEEINIEYNSDQEESCDEKVCFGKIEELSVKPFATVDLALLASSHIDLSVKVTRCGSILSEEDSSVIGNVEPNMAEILATLDDGQHVELQYICAIRQEKAVGQKIRKGVGIFTHCLHLSVIVYGLRRDFEIIGDYLDECGIYLQDPRGANQNVKYRNPHRLSGLDREAMTLDAFHESSGRCELLQRPQDWWSVLSSKKYLPETEGPQSLATPLYSHQKQALTFLIRREKGWHFDNEWPDIWTKNSHSSGVQYYTNNVSGETQKEPPCECRGGILADEMGLGKSLTMISLIAYDAEHFRVKFSGKGNHAISSTRHRTDTHVRTTLIVVPPPLLHIWEQQLSRHLRPGSLKWRRHHGKERIRNNSELSSYDIVITTYQTLAFEWRKRRSIVGPMFSVDWQRIVLDEAHHIRDPKTTAARSVCDLRAERRWIMTGTPIQNRLKDLVSLFTYLRLQPYSNPHAFNADIVQLWKTQSEEAILRLQRLINCIVIRRSTSTVDLPDRTDQLHYVNFSPAERSKYEQVRAPMVQILDTAIEGISSHSRQYSTILQGINALRMICNLGISVQSAIPRCLMGDSDEDAIKWCSQKAQDVFDGLVVAGRTLCTLCVGDVMQLDNKCTDSEESCAAQLSQCSQIICGKCYRNDGKTAEFEQAWCGHDSQCAMAPVSTSVLNLRLSDSGHDRSYEAEKMPAKIRALVRDLQTSRNSKSVVFSAWRSTLDLIEIALDAASIVCVRFDGKVTATNRTLALKRFQNDPQVSVILFTISCGSDGLDLTSACRAYLMEPQWNPTVEEQAFARIYRIGQSRPVTTIRYIVEKSYEDHVMEVQKKKRHFAQMLLPGKRLADLNSSLTRFQYLRSLLR